MNTTDRIEKQILLRAPLSRVWRALTNAHEFGSWFGMRADGPFEPGRHIRATVTPTAADPRVAEMQKPYAGLRFDMVIQRMEHERLFSFRWTHDPGVDPSVAVSTLVEFTLEDRQEGVLLTIVESGFDSVPLDRRAKLFAGNQEGWSLQVQLIEAYLAQHP